MKEIHKAKMTANMVMVTDGNGYPTTSTIITTTELNMLNNIRTNIQTQIDNVSQSVNQKSMVPNCSAAITPTNPYTAPSNGYAISSGGHDTGLSHTVNDVYISGNASGGSGSVWIMTPLAKGDVIAFGGGGHIFIPTK